MSIPGPYSCGNAFPGPGEVQGPSAFVFVLPPTRVSVAPSMDQKRYDPTVLSTCSTT